METVRPVTLLKRDIDACECEIFKSTLFNRTSPVTPSKPATLTQKFSCEIYEIFQKGWSEEYLWNITFSFLLFKHRKVIGSKAILGT